MNQYYIDTFAIAHTEKNHGHKLYFSQNFPIFFWGGGVNGQKCAHFEIKNGNFLVKIHNFTMSFPSAGYANMTRTPNIHTIILLNSYTRDHVRKQIFVDHFSNG